MTPRPSNHAITTAQGLVEAGMASASDLAAMNKIAASFRIRMTQAMRDAAAPDPSDPIAAQFVPDERELVIRPEELMDPIGDDAHSPVPGLTHRYPDRVIVHVTKTCEVYCRFCFRREVVGEDGTLPDAQLDAALNYIAATPAIREVILTGGDPMVLSARRLDALLARLDAIPHLDNIRIHTRIPVVAPHRIDTAMLRALIQRHLPVWVVLHTNHARELTGPAQASLQALARAGVPILSQTVLLRGINDHAETLAELFRCLIRNRVKPYYLHHCDLAKGTSHFRTTIAEGQAIMQALRGRMSGICLPSYVLDIPGGFGKTPLDGSHAVQIAPGRWQVTDWQGETHLYDDPVR